MRKTRQKVRLRNTLALLATVAAVVVLIMVFVGASCASNATDPADPQTDEATSEPTATPTAQVSATDEPLLTATSEPTPEPKTEPVVEYESLGEFTLTAYCPCVRCCGEWSAEHPSRVGTDYIQKTASGTIPTAGRTIGVDPSVIPFGTVVVINGHAYIAEDRGGAVKGNSIDIFFESHDEALEFGRQTAEVLIKTIKED